MFRLRDARLDDLETITQLYNELGVATTTSYELEPVSLANRTAWFTRLVEAGFPVLVACEGEQVIGFASYAQFRERAGFAHSFEHSVYVSAQAQHGGVGSALLNELIRRAVVQGGHLMIGMLDAENQVSMAFHRKHGFTVAGVIPQAGRKFGRWLDLAVLVRRLDDESAPTANARPVSMSQ